MSMRCLLEPTLSLPHWCSIPENLGTWQTRVVRPLALAGLFAFSTVSVTPEPTILGNFYSVRDFPFAAMRPPRIEGILGFVSFNGCFAALYAFEGLLLQKRATSTYMSHL